MPTVVTERWSPQVVSFMGGSYTANRIFDVTGAATETAAFAAVAAFDPSTVLNAQHPQNAYMYSRGPTSERPGFNMYAVKVQYQSTPAGRFENPGSPLLEPVIYRWNQLCQTEATDRDNANELLVNMAGEPFSQPYPTDVISIRVVAVRNEAAFDAATALQFGNSVNNANVSYNGGQWNVEKGQSKVIAVEPISEITSAAPFVKVQYTIDLKGGYFLDTDGFWDGFKLRILNQGRRGWWDDGGTPRRGNIVAISSDGSPQRVDTDVLLDATGKPIQPEFQISPANGDPPVAPIANPSPPSAVIETTSAGVVFIKAWPQSVKLKDHTLLLL